MAEKTTRDAVKDHLTTNCPSFTGGFFQPQIADANTTKPFGVVRMGPEDAAFRQGHVKRVLVSVHAERDDYNSLDSLVRSVVNALNDVMVFAGSVSGLNLYVHTIHVGTTADYNDDDRQTTVRTAEFETRLAR
jgi:hypothetical protein